ncbi:hypothetical protein EJD97_022746 [Solanum chilense]|uniref:Yippee domain-containing protein n=1 Tax=Solanum chilense TaxID=4083 RepID=A0A6N2B141_SOLCI|nr:hypothetical protein EJD97_022746 [Solanum chilense]
MPSSDYFHCRCGTRVALVQDYVEIDEELTFVLQGIFTDMFNVVVPENDESYHQVLDGNTVVDTLCVNCRDRLGWKFIAVAQGSPYEAGQFLMMLDKLNYTNGQLLDPYELGGGPNEDNVDQAGGANNADNQDGGANNADNQDGGANNADNQDGGGDQLVVSNGHSDRNPNI